MAPAQSTGGWGTIEGHRIRVLVLAPAERIATAQAIVRSLTPRHEVTLHAPEKVGFTTRVATAQLATTFRPHLIHQVGVDGVARSAGSVARGIGVPLVVSVDDDDLTNRRRRVLRVVRRADATVVPTEALADALREAKIRRDLYVTLSPDVEDASHDRFYLGAIEIVYGRVIHDAGVELESDTVLDHDGTPLVTIGGRKGEGGC